MKFPVLWSGLCCYTVKCSEILAHIKLLYNPRVNKVFTSLRTKRGSIFPETFIVYIAYVFEPMHLHQCFALLPYAKHCFQYQFLHQRANYAFTTRQKILTRTPAMRAVAKILRGRASEHSSNFCEI